MVDRKPAVIARCNNTADVVAAVNFAREQNLPLSVYGGGHGVTGAAMCDAGVCVDLRGMKNVTVDVDAKIAHADGGLTWGEFDAATQEHGLACTGGRVSGTGLAGLALGSGSGWLERKFGFVCDNLLAAEIVTADGRVVTASETENPDLFWGIRGGGGNFGIVTRFDLQLHDLGPIVYGGIIVFPAQMASMVVPAYREFVRNAPDEVGSGLAFLSAPPEEFVPKEAWGMPMVGIVVCYAGPVEDGEAAYQPLRDLGPILDMFGPIPYVALATAPRQWQPEGHAELLDRRLLRRAERRSDRDACRDRIAADLDAHPGHRRAGWRRDLTRAGRRDGVRSAPGRLQHPLPVDVGRPGRQRQEHRLDARPRRIDEEVLDRRACT